MKITNVVDKIVGELLDENVCYSRASQIFKERFFLGALERAYGNTTNAARHIRVHRNTVIRTLTPQISSKVREKTEILRELGHERDAKLKPEATQ